MPTKNRAFHIKLDNDWLEEIYQSTSRAEAEKQTKALEERFTQTFDEMVTTYQAAPATGDWVEFDDAHYHVAARTILAPGASGGIEIHILITRAPSAN